MSTNELYSSMFNAYPDVVTVQELCKMIGGIGRRTAYRLINTGAIKHIRTGKRILIPKVYVINYLLGIED